MFAASPRYAELLAAAGFATARDVLEAPSRRPFKEKRDRSIERLPAGEHLLWLKRHVRRGLSSLLLRSEARREWDALHAVRALGIATPEPVAYGERRLSWTQESFLLTRDLEGYKALEALALDRATRLRVARTLATLVRRFHEAGWRHRDLYLGHVFVAVASLGGDPELALVDLQRASRPRLLARHRLVKDLAALEYSARAAVPVRERLRFFRWYRGRLDRPLLGRVLARCEAIARHERRKGR